MAGWGRNVNGVAEWGEGLSLTYPGGFLAHTLAHTLTVSYRILERILERIHTSLPSPIQTFIQTFSITRSSGFAFRPHLERVVHL